LIRFKAVSMLTYRSLILIKKCLLYCFSAY